MGTTTDDLTTLIQSRYPVVFLKTWEEDRALGQVGRVAQVLKLPLFTWSITTGIGAPGKGGVYNTEKPAAALAHIASMNTPAIYFLKDFQPYLAEAVHVRMIRDLAHQPRGMRPILVLCGPEASIPQTLEKDAIIHEFRPPAPAEIRKLIHDLVFDLQQAGRAKIVIDEAQMELLVKHLSGMTFREIERTVNLLLRDSELTVEDIDRVVKEKQKVFAQTGLLEIVAVPPSMDQIGGLSRLKEWLAKRAKAFSPQAAELGLAPPKGVLLLGVQGCGKSLCAKAIAAGWGMGLARLDAASLYDKYVGESEKNLVRVLKQAEHLAPVVLWIDEIEKGLSTGGGGGGDGTDGGLSRRILGTFLNWMQERQTPVFIAATANDISRLPPELLRKGRFDEIFFVDLPAPDVRRLVFEIHLKKRKQDPARFDLAALVGASDGFSGAEIEQAVIDALYEVLSGRPFDTALLVEKMRATKPLSVVMAEQIAELRDWARERTVPAD